MCSTTCVAYPPPACSGQFMNPLVLTLKPDGNVMAQRVCKRCCWGVEAANPPTILAQSLNRLTTAPLPAGSCRAWSRESSKNSLHSKYVAVFASCTLRATPSKNERHALFWTSGRRPHFTIRMEAAFCGRSSRPCFRGNQTWLAFYRSKHFF